MRPPMFRPSNRMLQESVRMSRLSLPRRSIALALITVTTACAADAVAPDAPSLARRQESVESRAVETSSITYHDTTITVFFVDPSVSQSYSVGRIHKLWLRAGAICNPLTSSYGPKYWDAPCDPLSIPMLVTAKSWIDANGHPYIDFSPNLRFRPLGGKRASAELFMKDKNASIDPTAKILYCSSGGSCIDESIEDASLATRFDLPSGFVYRKIKHFSGYNITAGRLE